MSAPGTVLVTSRSFSSGDVDVEARLRAAGLEVVRGSTSHDLDELAPHLAHAVAWIAGTAPVTAAHLARSPRLRVLARYGVGVDAVDLEAAAAAGVTVTNTPGANSEAVSEHTVALVLAGLRGIAAADHRVRAGDWSVRRGRQLAGSCAGVVGFGRIGRGTARRLQALGCTVVVHDPFVPEDEVRRAGHEPVRLAELRARADVVALHAPGGRVLLDASWPGSCRPGQLVVNTARADLVDEAVVATALRDGRLGHYATDTLRGESDDGDRSPLLAEDLRALVTLTPHLGAQTTEAVDLMGSMAAAGVLAVLAGSVPEHLVRPPATPAGTRAEAVVR